MMDFASRDCEAVLNPSEKNSFAASEPGASDSMVDAKVAISSTAGSFFGADC
jgi:hypothetical protein